MQAIEMVVQVEEDVPLGRAKVTIQPLEVAEAKSALETLEPEEETREVLRARLTARGSLSTAFQPSQGAFALREEERTLRPGARPSHELIDEDRGPR